MSNQTRFKQFEFLNNLDTGVMKVVIPFLLIKMGINIGVFGFALSLKPIMDLTFRYVSSYLSDQFGRKTMSVIGQILGAFALLGYFFMSNVYHYLFIEILRAFSAIIFDPSFKAWKKESCNDKERVDFIMKLSRNRVVGTAIGGGLVIGMAFIVRMFEIKLFNTEINEQHFFLIFFLFELSAVILLFLMKDTAGVNATRLKKIQIKDSVHDWNVYLFMVYNAFMLSLTGAIALPFTAVYMTEALHLSLDKMGTCFAFSSVIGVLLAQKLMGKLKYSRPFRIIGILLITEGVVSIFIPWSNTIYLFTFIWLIYQTLQTSIDVLNRSQEQRLIKANTAQILQFAGIAASLGHIIGCNLGGQIWNILGRNYTYWCAGVLIFIIGISEMIYDFMKRNSQFSLPINEKERVAVNQ